MTADAYYIAQRLAALQKARAELPPFSPKEATRVREWWAAYQAAEGK